MRLGYYTPRFPFPQGASAGPYPEFVGMRPRVQVVMIGQKTACCKSCAKCPKKTRCHVSRLRHHRGGLRGLGDGSAAEIPSGSTIRYSVTYSQNISTPSPNQFIQDFTASLAPLGYAAAGSNLVSNTYLGLGSSTVVFTIVDTIGNALVSDAKGNLDNLAKSLTYNSVTGSTISVVSASSGVPTPLPASATAPGAVSAAASQDLANMNAAQASGDTTSAAYWKAQYMIDSGQAIAQNPVLAWIEQNPLYVAGGVLGLVFLWKVA